jgi:hypothetical protein
MTDNNHNKKKTAPFLEIGLIRREEGVAEKAR